MKNVIIGIVVGLLMGASIVRATKTDNIEIELNQCRAEQKAVMEMFGECILKCEKMPEIKPS